MSSTVRVGPSSKVLDGNDSAKLFHGGSALVEGCFLFWSEFDFDDLLDTLGAEFHRDADKEPVDTVFSVQIGGTGENLFLVFENGLDHFCGRGRRGIVRRSGLEIFD